MTNSTPERTHTADEHNQFCSCKACWDTRIITMPIEPVVQTSKANYEITRAKAIKALSALWDIAFPERSGERCQEWAEANHLCAIWDPDSLEDQQDAMPPGIWDLMLALGVTPAELIEHCHANPKLFEGSPSYETRVDPAAVLQWAVNSFGAIALNRDERAARMTEEAIEVAQVEGVPVDVIQRIAARVYSRPVGELGQEIGGLMVGLYALAANSGIDLDAEFRREFDRVLSKSREHWARKHTEKVAAGTADLSPTQKAGERQS